MAKNGIVKSIVSLDMLYYARRCSIMLSVVRASLESYVARKSYRETYSFRSYVELCTFVVTGSGGLAL